MRILTAHCALSLGIVLCISLIPNESMGEGTQQLGANQDIDVKTEFSVDILKVGEVINVAAGTNVGDGSGVITVTVTDPAGKAVAGSPFTISTNKPGYLPKPGILPPATITVPLQIVTKSKGTFKIKFKNSKSLHIDPLDITVTPNAAAKVLPAAPPGGYGRVHTKSWLITGSSYTKGTSPSFYVLVPVTSTSDVTWLMDFSGLAGYEYTVMGNASGLPGAYAGTSQAKSLVSTPPKAQFEVYLNLPQVAQGKTTAPKISGLTARGPGACVSLMLGMNSSFNFTLDQAAGYSLVVDIDKDGTFNPTAGDLELKGQGAKGANKVTWNGKDAAGKALAPGSYKARLSVKVGEFHFVADDVETVNPGLRIFKVDPPAPATTPAAALMYWDDSKINNRLHKVAPASSLPAGVSSGVFAAKSVCSAPGNSGVNAHCWGNFTTNTTLSPGDERYIDTWVHAHLASKTVAFDLLNPNADDDKDGLSNLKECAHKTDPKKADTDGDGIKDGAEVTGNVKTDPTKKDSDGDGINDGVEDKNKDGNLDKGETNPTKKDSDGDGLNDGVEDKNKDGKKDPGETDPLDKDTDKDGLNDGIEDKNKNGKVDTGETDPLDSDSDDDGLTDGWIDADKDGKWDPGEGEDRDNDGTLDSGETNPLKWSTDGACEGDGSEEKNGRDPLDPKDDVCGGDGSDAGAADGGAFLDAGASEAGAEAGVRTGFLYGTGGCAVGGEGEGGIGAALALGLVLALFFLCRGRRLAALAVVAFLLLWAGAARAAPASDGLTFPVANFRPVATMPGNFIVTDAGGVLPHLSPAVGVLLHYSHRPLAVYDADGELDTEVIRFRFGMDLSASIGFLDRVEIGLALPVTFTQESGDLTAVSRAADASIGGAVGDLRIMPKVRIATVGLFTFGVALPVTIPSGSDEDFLGESGGAITPRAIISMDTGKVALGLNLGVMIRDDQSIAYSADQERVVVDDQFQVSLGARVGVWRDKVDLMADFFLGLALEEQDREEIPAELLFGARFRLTRGFLATIGAGPGLTRGLGTPTFRFFAGLGYQYLPADEPAPRPTAQDRDGDGIPDASDKCPDQPEDMDGFEDSDGCPDPDNDGDGIPDVRDKCPLQAEDRDGFEDGDGCPEADNDGDGIPDAEDKCPLSPEDKDGFEDDDGCPDPDNDKDGLPDARDKCPNKPEAFNGVDDDDGCPDKGKGKVQVDVERRLITVPPVYFATGKDVILKRSFPTLLLVADVLKKNKWIELVSIEGHTDSRGSDTYNQDLSTRRAASVRRFLGEHGVTAKRTRSLGHGESKSVKTNNTADGRAANRRVEFLIVKPKG